MVPTGAELRRNPPELRHDHVHGRMVVIAPGRMARPGVPAGAALEDEGQDDCPFCEGRERETPAEVYALGPSGRASDAPGWRVRVFPNLYPAFLPGPPAELAPGLFQASPARGRQEVVANVPRHVLSLADLTPAELGELAEAWAARAEAARAEGYGYVLATVNEGRAAGASRPHTHSQLLWLPRTPPALLAESSIGPCRLCSVLGEERRARDRVVFERDGVVCLAPFASRSPYELMVAPATCEADAFRGELLGPALVAAADAIRRLRAVAGPVALNAWLHTSPLDAERGHWHLELVPRLSIFAGVELGAGIFINPLAPERAVVELRGAAADGTG
jgi:UDPglucose--hexose-1-phosphate uridylyltransferase